jgi:hypothetical protein
MPLDGTAPINDPLDIGAYGRTWLEDHYKANKKEGREKSLGASNIGHCARKTVHEKIGTPPSVAMTVNGFAFRGETYEEKYLVPMVTEWADKHHAKLILAGKDQIQLKHDCLTATPDGLVVRAPYNMLEPYGVVSIESDCFVVEFKSFDPRISDSSLPKPAHVLQVNAQIGLFRDTTAWQPKYGLIIYCNASDPADVRRFVVEFDLETYEGSHERARAVMTAVRNKAPLSMRPEGKIDGGTECNECPWDHDSTCGGYGFAVPTVQKTVAPEIVERAKELTLRADEMKRVERDAASERGLIEMHMKELMASVGTSVIRSDDFEVKWSKQPGRATFDRERALNVLVCDHGYDKEEFYNTGNSFDQLRYKRLT